MSGLAQLILVFELLVLTEDQAEGFPRTLKALLGGIMDAPLWGAPPYCFTLLLLFIHQCSNSCLLFLSEICPKHWEHILTLLLCDLSLNFNISFAVWSKPEQLRQWAWCCGVCVFLSASRYHTLAADLSDRRVWVPPSADCRDLQTLLKLFELSPVKKLHTGSLEPGFRVKHFVKILLYKLDTPNFCVSTISEDRFYRNCGHTRGEQVLERFHSRQDSIDSALTKRPFSIQTNKNKQQVCSRQLKLKWPSQIVQYNHCVKSVFRFLTATVSDIKALNDDKRKKKKISI